MKEYSIYIRNRNGSPYCLKQYSNIEEAKKVLYEMIQLEEERHRPYYVDNDFFVNKYNHINNLKYFCIKVRDVTEWSEYSEEKVIEESYKKIIYMANFKN